MSIVYLSNNFRIYPHQHLIEREGERIAVRPKTFALLLVLLEHPQEILSKKYLLDTIWDDVTVEEAVLVQSIRELRKLFDSASIIQTYPRKGYSWTAEVKKQLSAAEPELLVNSQLPIITTQKTSSLRYIVIAVAIIIVSAVFFTVLIHPTPISVAPEVVVVLPVKNELPDDDHNWVALGAMDQLINYLPTDKNTQTMPAEYVLLLMQHTEMSRDYKEIQLNQIFEASGASLVVETRVSGSVEDYRLDYKLRRKKDIKLGVVFDKTMEGALQKLATTIKTYAGATSDSSEALSYNAFSNELLARALGKMDEGEFQSASSLLESLKLHEPDNGVARLMLARAKLNLKDYKSAKTEIMSALTMTSGHDRARLHFLLAEVQFQQGLPDAALTSLKEAEKLNQSLNDILYLGYIAQLRGDIQHKLGLISPALSSYEQAIDYFSIIRCPIGASITHLQMAKLLFENHRNDQANSQYLAAKHLVAQHNLHKLEPMLGEFQARSQ